MTTAEAAAKSSAAAQHTRTCAACASLPALAATATAAAAGARASVSAGSRVSPCASAGASTTLTRLSGLATGATACNEGDVGEGMRQVSCRARQCFAARSTSNQSGGMLPTSGAHRGLRPASRRARAFRRGRWCPGTRAAR